MRMATESYRITRCAHVMDSAVPAANAEDLVGHKANKADLVDLPKVRVVTVEPINLADLVEDRILAVRSRCRAVRVRLLGKDKANNPHVPDSVADNPVVLEPAPRVGAVSVRPTPNPLRPAMKPSTA